MTPDTGDAVRRTWPDITLSNWEDTRDTLHMWIQVVGKIRMALTPLINHWWNVPLYVSARGLTTSLMHTGRRGLEIEFDFIDHVLELRTTDGARRRVTLEPRSVERESSKRIEETPPREARDVALLSTSSADKR